MAHLAELVAGDQDIHLSWHQDFVRAAGSQINRHVLELLEAGRFPIQDYLDLHGLGTEEAILALEKFLKQSRERGLRHVLLVHGKGKGSVGGESVLKETLSQRLCHKRFARWVLAFCSAQAKDGGTGAMYILLKTWQGPTIFRPAREENSS
jgi:DNA-nicking Smr family endonuclease